MIPIILAVKSKVFTKRKEEKRGERRKRNKSNFFK